MGLKWTHLFCVESVLLPASQVACVYLRTMAARNSHGESACHNLLRPSRMKPRHVHGSFLSSISSSSCDRILKMIRMISFGSRRHTVDCARSFAILDARTLDTRTLDARSLIARSLVAPPLVRCSLVRWSPDHWSLVRWSLVHSLDSRTLVARTLDARPLVARSLIARSLVARSLVARSLVARSGRSHDRWSRSLEALLDAQTLVARTLDARPLVARSLIARSLVARSLVAQSLVARSGRSHDRWSRSLEALALHRSPGGSWSYSNSYSRKRTDGHFESGGISRPHFKKACYPYFPPQKSRVKGAVGR